MSFEDLPAGIREIPLPDLVVADVLDLFVGPFERREGALILLLCDERDRILQPVAVDDVPRRPSRADRRQWIQVVTEAMVGTGGSVLIAVARPGGPELTELDRQWLVDSIDVCAGRLRLLGVWACSREESRRIG